MTAMCGIQLKYRKRSMDLMFMLVLGKTIDQVAINKVILLYQ